MRKCPLSLNLGSPVYVIKSAIELWPAEVRIKRIGSNKEDVGGV